MSLQPTGNQLTIRLYKKRCLVGLQKGILCKSIGRLFKDRRATTVNNKPPLSPYPTKRTSTINRGNTHLASLPVKGAVRAETAVILPFYVKYFYELTILSVNSEWQVGQYLPFLSRTFRDKFVSIKNTIVYKIKKEDKIRRITSLFI